MPYVVHHISRSLAFDPEILSAMGDAYDRSVQSFTRLPSEAVQRAIASQIIVMAERGLRDPALLCRTSLAAFCHLESEYWPNR